MTAATRAELKISSDLAELARTRTFVRQICRSLCPSLDDQAVSQLELAVNEAVCNIIIHAYRRRSGQCILIEMAVLDGKIYTRLYHRGRDFNPRGVRPPDFDGSRESGFGLYIMSRCVDEVDYSRDRRGRNCISLIKEYKTRGGGSDADDI